MFYEGRRLCVPHRRMTCVFPKRFCFLKTVGTQELTKDLATLEVIDEVGYTSGFTLESRFQTN